MRVRIQKLSQPCFDCLLDQLPGSISQKFRQGIIKRPWRTVSTTVS
jgi:hypothetical protein